MFDSPVLLQIAFWASFAMVVYAYPGYAIVIRCLASIFGRRSTPPTISAAESPRVSLLIAAYNEESIIASRIRNALEMHYPSDKLEIVVATDGCSDNTAEIVREFSNRGVRLLEYRVRRGKATVLNDSIPQLAGEVVILSDANTFTNPQAALCLARWFSDPAIGVVCGKLVLTDPTTGSNADSIYWKYETFLKRCEGRLGALLGANGGIYAVRRSCFSPIPTDTIVDDFVLPLQAKLRTGCSIVFDPRAIAEEETPPNISSEFRRRARIGAGGFQSLGRVWGLLNPLHGWIAFTFFSHKILRWSCPFFLLSLLFISVLLWNDPLYQWMFLAQASFYMVSALVPFVATRSRLLKPLRLTTMFTGMNVALLLGFCRWVSGIQGGTWQRTLRPGEA